MLSDLKILDGDEVEEQGQELVADSLGYKGYREHKLSRVCNWYKGHMLT